MIKITILKNKSIIPETKNMIKITIIKIKSIIPHNIPNIPKTKNMIKITIIQNKSIIPVNILKIPKTKNIIINNNHHEFRVTIPIILIIKTIISLMYKIRFINISINQKKIKNNQKYLKNYNIFNVDWVTRVILKLVSININLIMINNIKNYIKFKVVQVHIKLKVVQVHLNLKKYKVLTRCKQKY